MNKKKQNQEHYEQNKDKLKEKARQRYVEAKKLKRFSELLKEFATQVQLSETKFIEQIVEQTKMTPIVVVSIYKKLREDLNLTENQRRHIHNNIPAKKALLARLQEQHEVKDLL